MYERDDEELPPSTNKPGQAQDPIQELKNTAFLMSGLYQQLEAERSIITTASGQMTHAGKQFAEYLKKFGEIDKQVRNTIAKSIEEETAKAADAMANQVGDKLAEAATEQINDALAELKESVSYAKSQLDQCRTELKRFDLWRWVGFIGIALLGGFIGAASLKYFYPKQFTKEEYNMLRAGSVLINAWDHLSEAEQKKIQKFGK